MFQIHIFLPWNNVRLEFDSQSDMDGFRPIKRFDLVLFFSPDTISIFFFLKAIDPSKC